MTSHFLFISKDYFVWSHYRKLPPVNSKGTESSTSSELLKKVCQDKTRSTYQQDYVPHIQGRVKFL